MEATSDILTQEDQSVVQAPPRLKIPVEIELPAAEKRVFENVKTEKPESRKLKKLEIKFGELTDKNVE